MLLQKPVKIERHCPLRWPLAFGGGLAALAVVAMGLSLDPGVAEAAEPAKQEPARPATKPALKEDVLKDTIEKLKKDVGNHPDAVKQLDELLKALQNPQPGVPVAPAVPPIPVPAPVLPDDLDDVDELLKLQDQMRRQLEEILGAVGGRGGLFIGPGGIQPFPGAGGGRLGVRVERPSDLVASQLDLPSGKGLVISDVPAESTAGNIGLKPHDILLEVAGKPVSSQVPEFVRALQDIKENDAIDIVVMRKGKRETIKGVKLPAAKQVADPFQQLQPLFRDARLVPAPAPALPGGPATPRPQVIGPGESVRVEQVNDAFTVFYSKQGVKVTVTGSKEDGGQPKAESIEVDDNGRVTKAESIEKLPKAYQELARTALKSVK